MISDTERALTPAEQRAEYSSPEDRIRQGGRHPYASQDALERWSQDVLEKLGTWTRDTQAGLMAALTTQAEAILTLEARVRELELKDRTRDEYEAEMRDRG